MVHLPFAQPTGRRRDGTFWRGPLLCLVAMQATTELERSGLALPNPDAVFQLIIVYAALRSGMRSGLVCAALALGFMLAFYVEPGGGIHYSGEDLRRLVVSAVTSTAMAIMAGGLKRRSDRGHEHALAESEAWFATTLRSIGDAVIATDTRGRVVFLNAEAEHLSGWHPDDALGRPIEDVFAIVHAESRRPAEVPVAHALRGDCIVYLADQTLLIARDGVERPIADSAAAIRDGKGGVTGVVLIFRDITERTRAEAELSRQAQVLRDQAQLLDLAHVLIRGVDNRIIFWNRGAERLYGWTPEEALGQVTHTFLKSRFPVAIEEFEAALFSQGEWQGEIVHTRRDGTQIVVVSHQVVRRDEEGRPVAILEVNNDITDKKRAEEGLRESEAHFRSLADSMLQFVWTARPDGTLDSFNRRWLDYTGLSIEESEGWGWQSATHPDDLPHMLARWDEARREGTIFEDEYRLRRASDGVYRWHLGRAVPMVDAAGRIVKWFGTSTDIDEAKRAGDGRARLLALEQEARRQVEAAREEAEAANRAKDQFLAVLSHELRTPLTPVLAAASEQLDDPTTPESIRAVLEMTLRNVELEARLIDDLLDITRIARGKLHLNLERVDAHTLIRQAVEICRGEIASKPLNLELDLSAGAHQVEADPARLQQVVWNLIKNSVKFTPPWGQLTVRTRNVGPHDDGSRPRLIVEVADTGIGIAPEVIPKVFNAFEQGERTVTRRFGGLGLGLAIGRAVVEAHGGRLDASSAGACLGSTFTIDLATIPEPSAPRPGPRPRANGDGEQRPLKLLLVEDDADTLRVLSRLLRKHGHHVLTAENITTALELAATDDLDLIISDLGLPDGSGVDLMRQVTARRPIKAIALTGFGMDQDIQRCLDAGFASHLTKPINFQALDAEIRRIARIPSSE